MRRVYRSDVCACVRAPSLSYKQLLETRPVSLILTCPHYRYPHLCPLASIIIGKKASARQECSIIAFVKLFEFVTKTDRYPSFSYSTIIFTDFSSIFVCSKLSLGFALHCGLNWRFESQAVVDKAMRHELLCSRSFIFFIYQALLNKVLSGFRQRFWNCWQFLHLKLLYQTVEVSDAVPWVLGRSQLYQSASKRPNVTSAPHWTVCKTLRCHP